jgi:hypothetical protein
VPLCQEEVAELIFRGGVADLHVKVNPAQAELLVGRFDGPVPHLRQQGGRVELRHPHSWLGWMYYGLFTAHTGTELTLSPERAWDVSVRGGMATVDADFRGLRLRGLEVRGGISDARFTLPQPEGEVCVRISGGVSQLVLLRPESAPVEVRVWGGASRLEVDAQRLGAVGGPAVLRSPGFEGAANRYVVEVAGGASHLSVLAG